ncbi:MAG: metalloprotease PmbA [Stagnimonas sp.]|nr:metalloprotease PmbA [Stagnimonas sp.]
MSLPSATELETWAVRALEAARRAGASQAEVNVSTSRALTVNVRMRELESVEFQRDRDLHLTVYFGQRMGAASTGDLSEAGLEDTIAAACAIARAGGEDPCLGLADAELMARGALPELDLYHPWALTPELAAEQALACEAAAFAADSRVAQSEGASVDSREGAGVYANSHGFVGHRRSSDHSLSCGVIARDGEDMQNGHQYSSARAAGDLWAAGRVGAEAGLRAAARLGARALSTRRAPVLFAPEMARGLIGHALSAMSGGALYRKTSFLIGKLDSPVFAPGISVLQRPFIPRGAGSAAFDGEGVAARERSLVEDGVLRGWLLGSYAARKLGLASTGNASGAYNVVVPPGAKGFEDLLKEMGTGLLVTGLMGQGVNLVTGDYSRGAEGFWIENGEIQYPVDEVTVAGNLTSIYAQIVAVGSDVDTRGGVRVGSLLVDGMTIAGS